MRLPFLPWRLTITVFFFGLCLVPRAFAGTLTCTVTTSCPSGTVVFRMQATSNAQAELAGQSNYTQLVCCSGVTGLGTACSGTFATVLKLSTTTNAHAEQNSESNYANDVCLSVSSGSVTIGYQASNCTGYDTTLASISGTTNAHVGDSSAYTTKVCGTAAASASDTLSFSMSSNSADFGTLSSSSATYADASGGNATEVEAHQIIASTNASSGYSITVSGTTLTSGGNTISAIGGTNTASSAGTEQFGMRMTESGGNGSVKSPYSAAGFALDTAAFPDEVANDADGDDVATTYSVRYLANITSATEAGAYTATLTYVIVPNF